MIKTIKFVILNCAFVIVLIFLIMPVFSFAQTRIDPENPSLVPCGKSDDSGVISNPCDFQDFMLLINRVIDFIFKFLAMPIAAIMFVYAGILLVTSGGSTESRTKAKHIFTSALIGLVLAAAAWLIVKTLLSIVGYKDVGLFF